MDILTGNIEKSPNSEYQYKIRFYIERSINTNLDGARIDASNIISTRLRNLDSSNEKYLFLSETEEDYNSLYCCINSSCICIYLFE